MIGVHCSIEYPGMMTLAFAECAIETVFPAHQVGKRIVRRGVPNTPRADQL
jgi:hypothetical protein